MPPGELPDSGHAPPWVGGGRRPGECLRDRHPCAGVVAVDGELPVGDEPPLRDDEREVERGAGDAVGCVEATPGPEIAGRPAHLDPYVARRHRQAAYGEREAAGPDTEVADVPQPVGRGAGDAEAVGDVL